MVDRFSERARRVIVLATEEARRRGHGLVGPEHLLMGLLRDGDGAGTGIHLLDQFGASRGALLAEVDRALSAQPATGGALELSDALKRVLEQALAFDAQHCRRHVGPEHLICALLDDEAAPAFAIVRRAGADPERARRLLGMGQRLFARPGAAAVHLIATSPWRVRI